MEYQNGVVLFVYPNMCFLSFLYRNRIIAVYRAALLDYIFLTILEVRCDHVSKFSIDCDQKTYVPLLSWALTHGLGFFDALCPHHFFLTICWAITDIFRACNLMRLFKGIHPWKHHHSQDNIHIHQLWMFPCVPLLFYFALSGSILLYVLVTTFNTTQTIWIFLMDLVTWKWKFYASM